MTITILLFASLKDAANTSRLELDIAKPTPLGEFLNELGAQVPALARWLPHVRLAVNEEYVPDAQRDALMLKGGEEIALIPPVSGGAEDESGSETSPILARIVERPITLDEVVCFVQAQKAGRAGAICTFLGVVRENSRDTEGAWHEDIEYLDYEAYAPMAEREMEKICRQVAEQWEGACAILHRVGRLRVGETSVAIAVATGHRAESFEACRYAIETLKQQVPVWKKETARDGAWWSEGIGDAPKT